MPSPKLNFLPLKVIGDSASVQSREGMAKCFCVRGVICPLQLLDSSGRRRRGLSKGILCDAINGFECGWNDYQLVCFEEVYYYLSL